MVRMTSVENTSTLLGASHGPLELRVVSTHLAGQSVQLNSAKCTIGSGSRCTLRLQARRVEPVHCLILRGENGTVIRRWSPHTRLNGAAFTDALLQPGDRLTIGPIELDVVSTGQPRTTSNQASPAIPAEHSAATAIPTSNLADHSKLLAELEEREIALMAREEALASQQATFATERGEWEKSQAELRAELATRRDEHRTLTHELNNLRQLKQDLPDLLEDRQQYEDRRSQLASSEKALATAQTTLEAEHAAQEAKLHARRHELDEQAASLERTRQEMAAERTELEQKQLAAEAAWHQREGELNRRLSELEATQAEQAKDLQQREQIWQNSQTAWAAERAEWNTTCHETTTEFKHQQAELERQRQQFAAEQAEFAKQREALEAAVHAAEQAAIFHSEEPTELEHKETPASAAQHAFEPDAQESPAIATLFDAEQEEACDEEAFESPSSAEQDEQTAESSSHEHAIACLQLHDENEEEEQHESESHEELPDEVEAAAETEEDSAATEEEEAPPFEEPVKASPAESSGLMERLRAMVQSDDEDDSEEPTSHQRPSAPARPAFEPAIPLQSNTSKPELGSRHPMGGSSADGDEEEESIEDYMAKLMGRVRGDSPPIAPKPYQRPTVPKPEPVYEPEAEDPSHEETKAASTPASPFEMPQRQMPTELTSNLAAMRELANFSARDAIDTSVRNRWGQAAIGKFSVAAVAFATAGILLFLTRNAHSIQYVGAGIAMLIAIFWSLQGAIMLRNVWKANQLLAAKAKEPEEEAAKIRELLYSDSEDLEFDPSKPIEAPAQPAAAVDPTGDVVEIDSTIDAEAPKAE